MPIPPDNNAASTATDASHPNVHDHSLATAKPNEIPFDTNKWGPPWVGARNRRTRMDYTLCFVALAAAAPATIYFGWRSLAGVCLVGLTSWLSHTLSTWLIQRFKRGYAGDSALHAVTLGIFAGLSLHAGWNIVALLAIGLLVGVINHLTGRIRWMRIHPVAITMLITAAAVHWAPQRILPPDHLPAVLTPDHIVIGDVTNSTPVDMPTPWWDCQTGDANDAVQRPSPHRVMIDEQMTALHERWRLAHLLSSGHLRPMTEVIIGAVPGPIGITSPALVIILGLYMMFRRISTPAITISAVVASALALLAMPIAYHTGWTTVATRLLSAGPLVATTYVGYLFLASPLPWVVMVLAPQTAPMSRMGKVVYGVIIGAGAVAAQWFMATPVSAYISLALAGMLTPWLDRLHPSPFAR